LEAVGGQRPGPFGFSQDRLCLPKERTDKHRVFQIGAEGLGQQPLLLKWAEKEKGFPMKSDERAAQLWSLLVLAARSQQILSYSMVEHLTGLPRVGMGRRLSPIQDYCATKHLPPLTCIVVNEQTGLPGEGFSGARIEDLFREQARVFVFDWFSHEVPFPIRGKSDTVRSEESDD